MLQEGISMFQEAGHIKSTIALIFRHIQCLHLMYSEVSLVLVSSGTQVQPQIIHHPDYFPDYFFISYDYGLIHAKTLARHKLTTF